MLPLLPDEPLEPVLPDEPLEPVPLEPELEEPLDDEEEEVEPLEDMLGSRIMKEARMMDISRPLRSSVLAKW